MRNEMIRCNKIQIVDPLFQGSFVVFLQPVRENQGFLPYHQGKSGDSGRIYISGCNLKRKRCPIPGIPRKGAPLQSADPRGPREAGRFPRKIRGLSRELPGYGQPCRPAGIVRRICKCRPNPFHGQKTTCSWRFLIQNTSHTTPTSMRKPYHHVNSKPLKRPPYLFISAQKET